VENLDLIKECISNYFQVEDFHSTEEGSYFVTYDYDHDKFAQLIQDMDKIGYIPFMERYGVNYRIGIAQKPQKKGKSNIYINVLLFVSTVASTIFAGYMVGGNIWDGAAFSVAILSILGVHESAHFFAARKHGVEATLPYFIPAPTLIGTFGAVINVKSPIPDRNALFDLGCSGPIAGILVTVPVLVIGVLLSTVVPIKPGTTTFNPPLLMAIITYFLAPPVPSGYMLHMHPVAFAGWVGIIVTMLNLMPVSFLDGGHISRSLFSERTHLIISMIGVVVTVALGWIAMAVLMFIIVLMTKRHPGALDNVSKLTKRRKIMSLIMLIVLILCLTPIPSNSL
jgi:membrane-associated protease RseP (regulator of RpoE activity)